MSEKLRRWIHLGLVCTLLAASSAVMAWLIRSRPEPIRHDRSPALPQVAVMPVVPQNFAAPVVGHGTVKAKRQVRIIPQLTGRLTQVHRDLAEGKLIKKGELLFEIDPRSYESQVRQVEADVRRIEAQLARQADERTAIERRLEVARKQLQIADSNVERLIRLLEEQAGTTQAAVEQAQSEQLRVTDAVVELENRLSMYPHIVAETEAALEGRRAALEEARQNVERTRIFCPFNARVDAVLAQESQVVVTAFQIAMLTDMEAFEISAVLDPRDLQWTEHRAYARLMGEDLGTPPHVKVTWTLFGEKFSWEGQVTRLERHDEATRTAHVVVEVRNGELTHSPEDLSRPALSIGMFCRAELPAEPLPEALVIPRHAVLEDDTVYVFVPDPQQPDAGRLEIRHVPLLRTVGDEVVVAFDRPPAAKSLPAATRGSLGHGDSEVAEGPVCELKANDLLIVSPLPRAVPGMQLERRAAVAAAISDARFPISAASGSVTRQRTLPVDGRVLHTLHPLVAAAMHGLPSISDARGGAPRTPGEY